MNVTELNNVSWLHFTSDGKWVIVHTKDGREGIICAESGEFVIDLKPCVLYEIADNLFSVENKKCINALTGKELPLNIMYAGLKGQYVFGTTDSDGTVSLIGVCDDKCNIVIPQIYTGIYIRRNQDRYVVRMTDGRCKLIDNAGNTLSEIFDDVNLETIGSESISVCKNGEWYIIDESLQRVTKEHYDTLQSFSPTTGLAIFSRDGIYGLIDQKENVVMTTPYYIRWCNYGTLAFSSDFDGNHTHYGKATWGLMDTAGNITLPEEYTLYAYCPSKGHIELTDQNGKRGYVDRNGNVLLPFQYDDAIYIHKLNVYKVKQGDKSGVLDSSNNVIIPIEYDSIGLHYKKGLDMTAVTKNGRVFFLDRNGSEITL